MYATRRTIPAGGRVPPTASHLHKVDLYVAFSSMTAQRERPITARIPQSSTGPYRHPLDNGLATRTGPARIPGEH